MRKALGVLLAAALLLGLLPTAALAADVADNPAGATVEQIGNGDTMANNRGTVTNNDGIVTANYSGGTVTTNDGTVSHNHAGGMVETNNGTVTNNYSGGTVTNNYSGGTVANNKSGGTVTNNKSGGTVANNNGTVTTNDGTVANNDLGGTVETNNGTVATNNGTVTNNDLGGTVTNNNGTVTNSRGIVKNNENGGTVHNYDGTVTSNSGTVIEYRAVTVTGGEHAVITGLADLIGNSWIVDSTGTADITPAEGYRFIEAPAAAPADKATVTQEGDGYTLTGVTGDITLTLPLVPAIQVYVGDTDVSAGGYWKGDGGGGLVPGGAEDYTVAFAPETAGVPTLTLRGAAITKTSTVGDRTCGVYAGCPLILHLEQSETHSTVAGADNPAGDSWGMYVRGGLTVTGRGALTSAGGDAGGSSYGVLVDGGTLTVNGGALTGAGGAAGGDYSSGVYVQGDNVIIDGGVLAGTGGAANGATGRSAGVTIRSASLVMKDGILTGTGGAANGRSSISSGVRMINLTMDGGTLTGLGGGANGLYAVSNGVEIFGLTMDGGTLSGAGDKAVASRGVLIDHATINGGTLTGTGGPAVSETDGACASAGVEAEGGGITLRGGALTGRGGAVDGQNMEINKSVGVSALTGITVSGGALTGQRVGDNPLSCAVECEDGLDIDPNYAAARVWYGADEAGAIARGPRTPGEADAGWYAQHYASIDAPRALTVRAGAGGRIVEGAGGSYPRGAAIALGAQADAGSAFDGWTAAGGGSFADADSAFTTFVMPAGDAAVTAHFRSTGEESGGGGGSGDDRSPTEQAVDRIKDAKPGDTVKVDLPANGKLPGKVLEAAAGKDVTMEIGAGDGLTWIMNGLDIPKGKLDALNLKIDTKADTIPVTVINAITGEQKVMQLKLSHNGPFPFPLTLRLEVGKEHAGLFANLYYYNEVDQSMEFQTAAKISAKGEADLPFTHASSYAVVIDEASHAPMTWENPFTDVSESDWFYSGVEYVNGAGLMNGTSATTFGPHGPMTRGMLVTTLYRLAGSPPDAGEGGAFTDVPANAYYAPAVRWASARGIVKGTTATTFAPDRPVTRQEMAVLLYGYAQAMGHALPADREAVPFTDADAIGSWAADAVRAMQRAGILAGKSGVRFDPLGTATRAEVAVVLHRFAELAEGPATGRS